VVRGADTTSRRSKFYSALRLDKGSHYEVHFFFFKRAIMLHTVPAALTRPTAKLFSVYVILSLMIKVKLSLDGP
jgi:hypothetical protein